MLRYLFAFIMFMHGLIHFIGFAKAFGYGIIAKISKEVSKVAGVFWFLASILFIAATLLFLFKQDNWAWVAITAAVTSQVLIISVWKDAKFGTIANLIILLVAIAFAANVGFYKKVQIEAKAILSLPGPRNSTKENERKTVPSVVQKWLTRSGFTGKEGIDFVRLKQAGQMRTKPGGKWLPFKATQYFNLNDPAFVWFANVKMMPLITLTGRDKLEKGEGEMIIKLLSLFNIVNNGHNNKMNTGTMIRFLAETAWFPIAARRNYIRWEAIDSLSAKATMFYEGKSVSGVFTFNNEGDFVSFEALRYYGDSKEPRLEKWLIEAIDYREFSGHRIAYKSKVTWKLKEGDFTWLNLEIKELEYNNRELYD